MPNKKQTSRKNQGAKPTAVAPKEEKDDDWSANIIMKSAPNSRGSTRSNKVKPEPPPRVIPDWEKVGMSQKDYEELLERVAKASREYDAERYRENLLADWDSVAYWESRIESLEMSRERFNKKAAWSAETIWAVDEIDAEIAECERQIERIESEDRVEEGIYA